MKTGDIVRLKPGSLLSDLLGSAAAEEFKLVQSAGTPASAERPSGALPFPE